MQKNKFKKYLTLLLIFIFLVTCLLPVVQSEENIKKLTSNIIYKTWFVKAEGDNNNTGLNWNNAWRDITYAINHLSVVNGDLIRVGDGTYYENVIIDKQIIIEGNGTSHTVIDGNNIGDVISIYSDFVTINRVTITNCGNDANEDFGLEVLSNYNLIYDNLIIIYTRGIYLKDTYEKNMIFNNNFTSLGPYGAWGICINNCKNVKIYENNISNFFNGINVCHGSSNISISKNSIFSNVFAIDIDNSLYQNITLNNILNNTFGIHLLQSFNSTIYKNYVKNSSNEGITLVESYNNIVEKNHIIDNICGISVEGLFIGSNDNCIINNNFLKNNKDANFNIFSISNKWNGNYWDRPRILPKPIFGTIVSSIPWINFDWRPALKLYDII